MADSIPLIEKMQIRTGDHVVDVCTGSGVIAVHAALKGAGKVVALDINPNAIKAARENAQKYGVSDKVDVRLSDVYSALEEKETFDIITGNLPFYKHQANDLAEKTTWDQDLNVHKGFFRGAESRLRKNGKVYLVQSNLGPLEQIFEIARQSGFQERCVGEITTQNPPRTFYAFEFTRKKPILTRFYELASHQSPEGEMR